MYIQLKFIFLETVPNPGFHGDNIVDLESGIVPDHQNDNNPNFEFEAGTNHHDNSVINLVYEGNPNQVDNLVDLESPATLNHRDTTVDLSSHASSSHANLEPDSNEVNLVLSDDIKTIKVHRLRLKEDMINGFKQIMENDKIKFTIIDPRGEEESGVGIGVDRDLYTSFWMEVADSLCIGTSERVPFIRHDLYFEEWESIGKILKHGYTKTGYFPIFLAKAFVTYCLFGDTPLSNDLLMESFLNFVSPMDASLLKEALKTTNQGIYKDEDFIDLLDRYNCRSSVNPLNVYGVVLELAQQEIIQKPFIMVCSWAKTLQCLKEYEEFSSIYFLKNFYDAVTPSTKKVIKLFVADPKTEGQRCCYKYLLQYVRGLDNTDLVKLLRFLTGSDIILCRKIDVSFVEMGENAARRPIAHTCSPLLELPYSYRNFCELREEFQNILRVDSWGTDFT